MTTTTAVWKPSAEPTSYPSLTQDITVDVAIIGGGITGITAAYLLAKAGKKVAVLESRSVGQGSTGHSTGNLYAPVGSEGMHTVKQKWNTEVLQQVVQSRAAAVNFIEENVRTHGIDCDFVRVPWCLFSEPGGNTPYVEMERSMAEKAGLEIVNGVPFPMNIEAGFTIPNQAQFNPLQYTVGLAKAIDTANCQVYEHTKVLKVNDGDPCTLETTGGTVTASKVIMATHTPKGVYLVHTSLEVYREYAVAVTLNGEYPQPGIFWDMIGTEHYSMRTYDSEAGKVLLVLGESHKTGLKENNEECLQKLETFLRKKFDVASVAYRWAAQQYKPGDGIPHIGVSTGNTNTYIATGFAADGLTYGTLAAMILSDEILGRDNQWSQTYRAGRITPVASFTRFVKENATVGYELVKDWIAKKDADSFAEVQPNDGKVMEVNNKRCAVHRDESGELHVVSAVCPHMGCIVHWNKSEKTWDCPCHGSRFQPDGELIEGPAINGLAPVEVKEEEN
ncbi:FAD-dependent oxidoreductase [Aridibaculum aurantiacum]|uniref:FAD-dependent oxidoreductase n=1 Tax=Aridibaculum aurantiacum TaxID=2810307 RepID=UPI001A95C3FC|nr:FAD-dependent oxidoreductase [Aridibaculum aurantiacum]